MRTTALFLDLITVLSFAEALQRPYSLPTVTSRHSQFLEDASAPEPTLPPNPHPPNLRARDTRICGYIYSDGSPAYCDAQQNCITSIISQSDYVYGCCGQASCGLGISCDDAVNWYGLITTVESAYKLHRPGIANRTNLHCSPGTFSRCATKYLSVSDTTYSSFFCANSAYTVDVRWFFEDTPAYTSGLMFSSSISAADQAASESAAQAKSQAAASQSAAAASSMSVELASLNSVLASISAMATALTTTKTASGSTIASDPTTASTSASNVSNSGISGGRLAGAIVGSIFGTTLFVAVIILALLFLRKIRGDGTHDNFNSEKQAMPELNESSIGTHDNFNSEQQAMPELNGSSIGTTGNTRASGGWQNGQWR
jgi:hypothetical protein